MGKRLYKYDEEYIFTAYELAKEGKTEKKIAKILGISFDTLVRWEKKKIAFGMALQRGRKIRKQQSGTGKFREYVFKRLSPKLHKIWKEINTLDDKYPNTGAKKIEALLQKRGVRIRQFLFINAWVSSNFSVSAAMTKLNVPRCTFEHWKKEEEFALLIEEILWHKNNFFEDSLMRLVASGDTSAIIYANRTQNRARGYNEKTEIVTTVDGEIRHQVGFDELNLPMDLKKQILKHLRSQNEDGQA